MAALTFYMNPQSRSRIVRWMLEETGIDYDTKVVAYGPEMKSESYLSINSMGKVPAITHGGKVVTECAAICAYLADICPDANLAPPIQDRAAYYRWLFFAAGPLESAVMNKGIGLDVPKDKSQMLGYGSYELTIDALVHAVSGPGYLGGTHFSAADVYVGAHIGWGLQFNTIPPRKELSSYFAKVSSRPAFARANQLDDDLI